MYYSFIHDITKSQLISRLSCIHSYVHQRTVFLCKHVHSCLTGGTYTIEDVKEDTKATDQQLNKEIQEKDIYIIARYFETVPKPILSSLNLLPSDRGDVNRIANQEGIQAGMAHALGVWRKVNPAKATFRNLILIVLEKLHDPGELAKSIARYAAGNSS